MKRKDLLIDKNNEISIEDGDFVIGNSDLQHVDHILRAQPGEYKDHPQLGLGIHNYLKTPTPPAKFERDVRIQLNYDGYKQPQIDLTDGYKQLKINV